MTAVVVRAVKPKMTMSAVQGKILVYAEDGERIGQWGGTECFLSRQPNLGPCLVVRSSRHKKHQGTFFQLQGLQRVLSTYVSQGRMTVMVPHQKRLCSVFIETTSDVEELRMMAAMLQDRRRWADMEVNVASKQNSSGGAGRGRGRPSAGESLEEAGDMEGFRGARDPLLARLSGGALEEEDDDGADSHSDRSDHQEGLGAPLQGHVPSHLAELAATFVSPFDNSSSASPIGSPLSGTTKLSASASSAAWSWSADQQRATALVRAGKNVFVTGAAGSGKSVWLRHVVEEVLPDIATEETAITASTGMAARLLGGTTLHHFAGIGRGEGSQESIIQRVRSRADAVRGWQLCRTLIIDEVSMLSAHIFDLVDAVARAVREGISMEIRVTQSLKHKVDASSLPFGGIQVVVVGDFMQLPPVSRGARSSAAAGESGGSLTDPHAAPSFASAAWQQCRFQSLFFAQDYRHATDHAFAQCCAEARMGMCSPASLAMLKDCVQRPLEERLGVEATTLMARRKDVDRFNAMQLDQLEAVEFFRYLSEDYASIPGTDIDAEVSLPSVLTLKLGAQVVLLSTLPDCPSLTNGSVGVVISFAEQTQGPSMPLVRFTTGEEVLVKPVTVEVYGRAGQHLVLARTQVPLQLAWALTVHRVQGMTLPMVRVGLDSSFFEEGQAYVALSRVRAASDLCLTSLDPKALLRVNQRAREFYSTLFPEQRPAGDRNEKDALSPEKSAGRASIQERETKKEQRSSTEVDRTEEPPLRRARMQLDEE